MDNTTIILLVIAAGGLLIYKMKKDQDDYNNNANAQGGQTDSRTQALNQLNLQNSIANTVVAFIDSQNECLPVFVEDWQPIADIPKEHWEMAKQTFAEYGKNYAKMHKAIENVSSNPCNTGFYKPEFNNIRYKLKQRTTW